MPHLRGTLFDHLVATEDLLRSWSADEDLCQAGLCHAAYGTDGFAPFLVPWDDRGLLVAVCTTEFWIPATAALRPASFALVSGLAESWFLNTTITLSLTWLDKLCASAAVNGAWVAGAAPAGDPPAGSTAKVATTGNITVTVRSSR
jgi:hypothetical protein